MERRGYGVFAISERKNHLDAFFRRIKFEKTFGNINLSSTLAQTPK